jgi:hypothetical protein
MPQHSKRTAKTGLADKTKDDKPTRRVREVVTYDHPPVRAACLDESTFIHNCRTESAPLTRMQEYAIQAFKQGTGLPEIAKSSGLPLGTLVKTLKAVGLSEETHKKQLEALQTYYENRRNP